MNSPPAFAPTALLPETPPLLCARQLLSERVQEMVKFEAGTRSGEDLEALHDMRVWSRRLREALEIFAHCFPEKMYNKLYARVRHVTKALGKAREADVAVHYFLQRHQATEDLLTRFALEDWLSQLVETQMHARRRMQHKLDHKAQPHDLPEAFAAAFAKLATRPATPRRGPRTALRLARVLWLQRLRAVFAARAALTGENDVEGLHNLRIAVKKLRYALETLHFVAAGMAQNPLKFWKKLQTVLGEIHDRDVFLAQIAARREALQQRAFSDALVRGYALLAQHLAHERAEFYHEYARQFAEARFSEWQKQMLPPAPAKKFAKTSLQS